MLRHVWTCASTIWNVNTSPGMVTTRSVLPLPTVTPLAMTPARTALQEQEPVKVRLLPGESGHGSLSLSCTFFVSFLFCVFPILIHRRLHLPRLPGHPLRKVLHILGPQLIHNLL